MQIKEIAQESYTIINDAIQFKLLNDYKDNKISVDEYRKVSRGISSVLFYLETK